eukprot:s2128_g5.t1
MPEIAAAWPQAVQLLAESGSNANIITFNATATACARGRQWQASLDLVQEMLRRGIEPSPSTWGAQAAACERGSHWTGALQTLDDSRTHGIEPHVITISSVIKACGTAQRWDLSLRLLHEAQARGIDVDVITFNCTLGALSRSARWQQAQTLLSEMEGSHCLPDDVSYKLVADALRGAPGDAALQVASPSRAQFKSSLPIDKSALEGRLYGHEPVLCTAVVEALLSAKTDAEHVVDATFGGGGHSRALLRHLPSTSKVFAFDVDASAMAEAGRTASSDPRLVPRHAAFGSLHQVLPPGLALRGLLADLGVSSMQLDRKHRGFSPIEDGPLDLRMVSVVSFARGGQCFYLNELILRKINGPVPPGVFRLPDSPLRG